MEETSNVVSAQKPANETVRAILMRTSRTPSWWVRVTCLTRTQQGHSLPILQVEGVYLMNWHVTTAAALVLCFIGANAAAASPRVRRHGFATFSIGRGAASRETRRS